MSLPVVSARNTMWIPSIRPTGENVLIRVQIPTSLRQSPRPSLLGQVFLFLPYDQQFVDVRTQDNLQGGS